MEIIIAVACGYIGGVISMFALIGLIIWGLNSETKDWRDDYPKYRFNRPSGKYFPQ